MRETQLQEGFSFLFSQCRMTSAILLLLLLARDEQEQWQQDTAGGMEQQRESKEFDRGKGSLEFTYMC